jgi:riboflavin synthase
MFPIIQDLLQKRFHDVRIIPPNEFPGLMDIEPEALPKLLNEKGCDGAIIGNAA